MRFNFWKKKRPSFPIPEVKDYWLFIEPPQPSMGQISQWPTISGIAYALFVSANASKVLIIENITRHIVEIVVESGEDSLIADAIYQNIPVGILTGGDIELTVKVPGFGARIIKFSRFR